METERIPTSDPVRHLWNRFGVLASHSGAREVICLAAQARGATLDCELREVIDEKARGVAFCVRSAREYFQARPEGNLTSACVAYYYGTLYLLEALLLADPKNNVTLDRVERYTRYGHGLRTWSEEAGEFPAREKIAVMSGGFLPSALSKWQYKVADLATKRVDSLDELDEDERARVFSVKDVLGRIPELRDLYAEAFFEQPDYVSFENPGDRAELQFPLHANTPYLTPEKIRDVIPWLPVEEAKEKEKYGSTYLIITMRDDQVRGCVRRLYRQRYRSVMAFDCCVRPLMSIDDVLLFQFMLLYCLSIWVRYRPALWRMIMEGELDRFAALFGKFLMAVERIVPNEVLNRIYGKRFLFAPFSYIA